MDAFVNRESELDRLRALYESSHPELAIIYGRRRLGKTELVKQSISNRDDAIIYQARQKTSYLQRQQFIDIASEQFPEVADVRDDWEVILRFLATKDAIVVLDEFPYLVEEEPSLPSILQALFDHEFEDTATTFVLVGSSIAMMEDAALLGNSPLFGRSSLKLDIRQLSFSDAKKFYSAITSPDEHILFWSIFGGVPYYLEHITPENDLSTTVTETILSRHGLFHNEPDFILRMELTEPTRYFSILEAIAGGKVGRNEIAGATGIEYNQLSKYLNRLERLRLIERVVPVTEDPARSKRGRYRIRDHFFRFWFRFVYGAQDRYDTVTDNLYHALIEPEIADFASEPFEALCRSAIPQLYPAYSLTDVGSWWYDEHEIDVVGLTDEQTLIAGECKFQQSPMSYDVLARLESTAAEIRWSGAGMGDPSIQYALFSRSGFSRSISEAAENRSNVQLFSIDDVLNQ